MKPLVKEEREADVYELNKELNEELSGELGSPEPEPEKRDGEEKRRKNRRKRKLKTGGGKKKIRPFKVFMILLCILILFLAVLASAFFILRSRGKKKLMSSVTDESVEVPEAAVVEEDGKSIVYNGARYCYNEDIITILCMGIDRSIQDTAPDNAGANGQADAVFLAVLDRKTGELSFVNVSRDSMVDVNKYNVQGQFLGTDRMQLCLAYAYGDGKKKSCENTAEAVSRLMYGIPINAYAAIEYSGISVLNDAVGGVTVEVLEDLSASDPALQAGRTVTLDGKQAHTYVRSRDTSLLDSNNLRMARQKQYLTAFLKTALGKVKSDLGLVLTLYQTASEYMVTDIGTSEMTYLASLVLQKGFSEGNMYSVPGSVVKGDEYAEFIPDERALYELILDVFYKKEG